jgi:hypothetical protein
MRRSTSRRIRALVTLGVGLFAACAPYHTGGSAAGDLGATIYFKNESFDQVAVYAVLSGVQKSRIGTVMAGRTDTLALSPSIVGSPSGLTILVRPLGRDFTAEIGPITINPGEAFDVALPPNQRMLVMLPARR